MNRVSSIIVLGVGNTLMQDDGIGVWAVRAMAERYDWPSRVRLMEGGVAGFRLLSDLDSAEALLIIDAVKGGGPPGTLYRLTPEDLPDNREPVLSAHKVGIAAILSVAELRGRPPRTRILGVEPRNAVGVGLELTPLLRKALPRVVRAAVEELRGMGVSPLAKKRDADA